LTRCSSLTASLDRTCTSTTATAMAAPPMSAVYLRDLALSMASFSRMPLTS
jgi:hypothetical protein